MPIRVRCLCRYSNLATQDTSCTIPDFSHCRGKPAHDRNLCKAWEHWRPCNRKRRSLACLQKGPNLQKRHLWNLKISLRYGSKARLTDRVCIHSSRAWEHWLVSKTVLLQAAPEAVHPTLRACFYVLSERSLAPAVLLCVAVLQHMP